MSGSECDVDQVLELLGDPRRRFTLYYLLSNEYTNVDSLSLQIAAWEQSETVASVGEEGRQSVEISLYHNHLPRLADHDVVEFDSRNGDIVRSDAFDDVRPVVERLRTADEGTGERETALEDRSKGPELDPFVSRT